MKQNKPLQKLAAAAVLVLLTAACTQGEAEPGTETGAMVPLTIEASLTGELVQPATRAVINNDGAQIGVFLTNQGGYKPQYDKKYTYTAEGWKAAGEPVCVSSNPARVPAYYDPNSLNPFPANSFETNPNALTAQLYADSKLWYYDDTQTSVTNANPAIAFKMKPAYARVILSIVRGPGYLAATGPCKISNVALSSNNQFYQSRTLDISNSTLGGTATPGVCNIALPIAAIPANTTNTQGDLLLPPQPITTNLLLALTIDGKTRSIAIPAASNFAGNALNAGTEYTIHLLITDANIVLGSGGISDSEWGGRQDQDGGKVTV